jgi:hypothetical protein
VWAPPEKSLGFGLVLRAIEAHGRMDVPLPEGPAFFRFSSPDECRRAFEAAGFVDTRVVELPLVWRLRSADALYEAFLEGAVRTAALLREQTASAAATIRRAVREGAEAYRVGATIELPMAAVLASATRA